MKKLLTLILTTVLCLCCLVSCGSKHRENTWFAEETLTKCLVDELPTIEKDYVNNNDQDIYVNFTSKEREAYINEIYGYLKSQNFKYFGTRGAEETNLAGTFITYNFESASELSEFYVDGAYIFVYSDGTLDENNTPIFCIVSIYESEENTLEYGTKTFSYNTLITLRYEMETTLSGKYILKEDEHASH